MSREFEYAEHRAALPGERLAYTATMTHRIGFY